MGVVVRGATRANFWLRNVQPAQTFWYAQQHDDNVWDCFSRLTEFSHESPEARLTSSVPLGKGGLGLLSAVRIREVAHGASWAEFAHGARKDDGRWVGTESSQLFHSRLRVCAVFG